MTQPPAGGPGVSDGDAEGWRAPESAPQQGAPTPQWGRPAQWGQPAPASWGTPGESGPRGWEPAGYAKPPAGIVPLRPLSVGEILDGAFQAVRANARTMVGSATAVVAAIAVLSFVPESLLLYGVRDNRALQGSGSLDDQLQLLGALSESWAFSGVLTFIAVTMLNAMLIVPVSEAVLGRRMDARAMWRRARGRLLAALGLSLLIGVAIALALVALVVPSVVAFAAGSDAGGVILGLAAVVGMFVVFILLYTRWSLAAPALVLENAPVTTAMRRS